MHEDRCHSAGQVYYSKYFVSFLCQEGQGGVRRDRQRFQKLSPVTLGQSPSKQRTLDTLVSRTSPSLAKKIHAVSKSVVNSSHCSVSFIGDLHLVTSDFMDLVHVIKTRKYRN